MVEADDFEPLLKMAVTTASLHFIVVDGIDECSEYERTALFTVLRKTVNLATAPVKVLLTSRSKVVRKIENACSSIYSIAVNPVDTEPDIAKFVESTLIERLDDGSLVAGSPDILEQIQQSLTIGAQGM